MRNNNKIENCNKILLIYKIRKRECKLIRKI